MAGKLSDYLAAIGSKGGKTTGPSKVRGDSDYYKRISKKAADARKASKQNTTHQRMARPSAGATYAGGDGSTRNGAGA